MVSLKACAVQGLSCEGEFGVKAGAVQSLLVLCLEAATRMIDGARDTTDSFCV